MSSRRLDGSDDSLNRRAYLHRISSGAFCRANSQSWSVGRTDVYVFEKEPLSSGMETKRSKVEWHECHEWVKEGDCALWVSREEDVADYQGFVTEDALIVGDRCGDQL